jgi:pyridoxine 5-phosphate synthase
MTVLSVNVNKVAVLRNSRGGAEPSVVRAAEAVIAAGAAGITVHPRPDLRHIRPDDVFALAELCRGRVEFNIEGNPFAPARGAYPGLLALVAATRPQQVTVVPDGDGQLTSDHGFDLRRDSARLRPLIAGLRQTGARVSLFMDAGAEALDLAAEIGAERIELYTGPFAEAFAAGTASEALQRCAASAAQARTLGLAVNAGHDLSQANLGAFLHGVPAVAEVSIGHALIGEALYAGLDATVRAYLRILAS